MKNRSLIEADGLKCFDAEPHDFSTIVTEHFTVPSPSEGQSLQRERVMAVCRKCGSAVNPFKHMDVNAMETLQ